MSVQFAELIAKISGRTNIQILNDHLGTAYQNVRFLTENLTEITPKTIYVGETSKIKTTLRHRSDVGFIVINNCDYDLTLIKGEVAEYPLETDLFEIFNSVLDIMKNKRRHVDIAVVLLNCLIQGKGLNEIIQIGAELIGNPISLVDYAGKLLAVSDQQEINRMNLSPEGYLSQETYSVFRTYNFTKKVNESPDPVLLDIDHPDIPRMIVGKLMIRNKIVGHLSVVENDFPITEDDIEIAKLLIDVVTAIVQKDNYYLLMGGIHHEYFLLDLLQENHDNPTTMEEKVKSLQWDTYQDFFEIVISIPKKTDAFFFVEYFRARLGNIFPFSKSIYFDENVILVIYKEKDLQKILKKLTPILLENDLSAGISQHFSSIIDFKRHYEQAKKALSLGILLKKSGNIFLYDDLYIYDLLTILNRNANLKDFCHPGIETILEFDKENGTEYYKTLYVYIMNSANMALAAKKLYIHRNTLYHRIKKISEITQLDLGEGEDYLKILLSYKIIELYNLTGD